MDSSFEIAGRQAADRRHRRDEIGAIAAVAGSLRPSGPSQLRRPTASTLGALVLTGAVGFWLAENFIRSPTIFLSLVLIVLLVLRPTGLVGRAEGL